MWMALLLSGMGPQPSQPVPTANGNFVEGSLALLHHCRRGGCDASLELTDASGQRYAVELEPSLRASMGHPTRWNGKWVRAEYGPGNRRYQRLIVRRMSVVPKDFRPVHFREAKELRFATKTDVRRPAPQTGAKPFVTILAKFGGNATEGEPKSFYETLLGMAYPGVGDWMRVVSQNQIDFSGGVVHGWVNLPKTKAQYTGQDGGLDYGAIIEDAAAQVDSLVDFRNYYGINVMVNDGLTNGIWGIGGGRYMTLDGQSRVWGITCNGFKQEQHLMTHEMGHAIGLPHAANSWGEEYGSIFCTMGSGYWSSGTTYGIVGQPYQMHHRYWLGWLNPNRIYYALPSTTRTIRLERRTNPVSATDPLMVKAYHSGYGNRYYTVEALRRTSYEGTSGPEGLVIAEVDEGRWRMIETIDVNNNNNLSDPGSMLGVGQSWTRNGITFECLSADASGYNVRVTVAGTVPWPNQVTSGADAGPSTLRSALAFSMELPQYPVTFRLPQSDPSFATNHWKINLASALPELNAPVTIDASTQTTFGGNLNPSGPEVILDGTSAGDWTNGFLISGADVTIRGFGFGGFRYNGIGIHQTANRARVVGNVFGLRADGTPFAATNNRSGITVWQGPTNTTIGGPSAADRNVFGGMDTHGVQIWDNAGPTTLQNNWAGFNPAGANQPLTGAGFQAVRSANVTVLGNVLGNAGNSGFGGWEVSKSLFQGNWLGLNPAGTAGARNAWEGIALADTSFENLVGGWKSSQANWFGPSSKAVGLWGAGTLRNHVVGNRIGTLANGTTDARPDWGIFIHADSQRNRVENNVITFANEGIWVEGERNRITGNRIGFTANGNPGQILYTGVVVIGAKALYNQFGGTQGGEGNMIGHGNRGIGFWNGASNNSILGNVIGFTRTGQAAPMTGPGLLAVSGSSNNQFGAMSARGRNYVGNAFRALELWDANTNGNRVLNNWFGRSSNAINGPFGAEVVLIQNGPSDSLLEGNLLTGGNFTGLLVIGDTTLRNRFHANEIFANSFGIDLNINGVSQNDPLDADGGANGTTNFPVLWGAVVTGGNVQITGQLDAAPNTTYRLDFFASPSAHSSGYGQGQSFLGFATVRTNSNGTAAINVTLPNRAGAVVTATATGPDGTSEFALAVAKG